MIVVSEVAVSCGGRFNCPFCSCLFFTEHDLALHLRAFSDVGEAHKDAVRRPHEFIEEFGSERLSDDLTGIEFVSPEQTILSFECAIRSFYGLSLPIRRKFRR